ncbi:hypothetical protein AAFM79_16105 [Trichormus azollae HNT15244]|jgi:hypothetical protein
MQIFTSWMEQLIEQGIDQGIQLEKDLIVRLIKCKLGKLDPPSILSSSQRIRN